MISEFNFAKELIDWMDEHNFKCYIEKGTGRHLINRKEKVIILDFASKDFKEKSELAKKIVEQLVIKEKIKAAKIS